MTSSSLDTLDSLEQDRLLNYQIPGWFWPSEVGWAEQAFRDSHIHLEIGSYCGRSMMAAARFMNPGSQIISVDPHDYSNVSGKDEWVKSVYEATCRLIREKYRVNVVHFKMKSAEAFQIMEDYVGQVDSVFIDGLHELAECSQDIEYSIHLLRPGGILSGHDYDLMCVGVREAVNATLGERQINFEIIPSTRIWTATKN